MLSPQIRGVYSIAVKLKAYLFSGFYFFFVESHHIQFCCSFMCNDTTDESDGLLADIYLLQIPKTHCHSDILQTCPFAETVSSA